MGERIFEYEPLWGDWQIDALIGEGSFGKVYKVKRVEFDETYYSAVKIITIPQNEAEMRHVFSEGMDPQSVKTYFENFVRDLINEIKLMSNLKGLTNIVSLEDHKIIERSDRIGWDILIRMELLKSLPDYLLEHTLTRGEIIKLGIDICRALELCQKYNIIHRDIKPDNIFVSKHGDFKLGDFGIARQIEKTMTGLSKKGTFSYMAPEVYKGQPYNSSVDIYSLGLVLYRFANNNRIPFLPDYPAPITHSDREEALIRRIRGDTLPMPVNADERLGEIILKAAAGNPKERYESPGQMCEALKAIQHFIKGVEADYPAGDSIEIDPGATDKIEVTQTIYENINEEQKKDEGTKTEELTEKSGIETIDRTENLKAKISMQQVIDKSTPGATDKGRKRWILGIGAGACVLLLVTAMLIYTFSNKNLAETTNNKGSKPQATAKKINVPVTASEVEKRGNTTGNISNQGICSMQGEWIYYASSEDGDKLYAIGIDDTGKHKIADDRPLYINVIGDWIYYSNQNENGKLYRIRTDGTGRQKLSDDNAQYTNAVGDWIYYCSESDNDGGKLYKVRMDGTNKQKLNDDDSWYINVSGDWIYYSNKNDGNKLYKMRTDGTGKVNLDKDISTNINAAGDWIYYSNLSEQGKLYRIRTDGTGKQKLHDDDFLYANVVGDWIYYVNGGTELCKVRTDGTERKKLSDDSAWIVNVAGDWIYYFNSGDSNKLYRIGTDGTKRQRVN